MPINNAGGLALSVTGEGKWIYCMPPENNGILKIRAVSLDGSDSVAWSSTRKPSSRLLGFAWLSGEQSFAAVYATEVLLFSMKSLNKVTRIRMPRLVLGENSQLFPANGGRIVFVSSLA